MARGSGTKSLTITQVKAYLASKGIPQKMITVLIAAMVSDAITEADNMKVDRIYTIVALMLHDEFDMNSEDIIHGLQRLDSLFGEISDDDELHWTHVMERLDNECGLIIRSGDEHRIVIEYARGVEDTDEVAED